MTEFFHLSGMPKEGKEKVRASGSTQTKSPEAQSSQDLPPDLTDSSSCGEIPALSSRSSTSGRSVSSGSQSYSGPGERGWEVIAHEPPDPDFRGTQGLDRERRAQEEWAEKLQREKLMRGKRAQKDRSFREYMEEAQKEKEKQRIVPGKLAGKICG